MENLAQYPSQHPLTDSDKHWMAGYAVIIVIGLIAAIPGMFAMAVGVIASAAGAIMFFPIAILGVALAAPGMVPAGWATMKVFEINRYNPALNPQLKELLEKYKTITQQADKAGLVNLSSLP